MLRCREGADSPRRDFNGLTSGVLLVLLLFEEPEMEAWTEATTLACSGGTYLGSSSHHKHYIKIILLKKIKKSNLK